MNAIIKNHISSSWFLPVLGGGFIAVFAAFILRSSYVWAGLVSVGLSVAVMSFVAKDFKSYWLAIFAIALPLDIKKMLIDAEYVRDITNIFGIPLGEMPAPIIYLSDLALIVLMAQWFSEILSRKQKIIFPKSNWMALAFVIWSAISLINARVFAYGFFDLLRTFKLYILYLYIANNVNTETVLKNLIKFLFIGVVIQGLFCIYQFVAQDAGYIFGNLFGQQDLYSDETLKKYNLFFAVTPGSDNIRASGTVGPTNAEAQFFEFFLPMALLFWLAAAGFWTKIFNLVVLSFGLVGLVLTFSRGGFVGIFVGIVVTFFLARFFKIVTLKKFIVYIFSASLLAVLIIPKCYAFFMTRHEATLARFHLYKVGIDMIRANPIFGVGLNNHLVVSPQFDPDNYLMPTPTHNHYLILASEIGIPGLIFYIGFLVITCMMLLKMSRSESQYVASVSLGMFGALIAISVHILVDHLNYHTILTLIWLYGGLASVLTEFEKVSVEEVV